MTDYLQLAVVFFAAINPAWAGLSYGLRDGAGRPGVRTAAVAVGLVVAAGLLAVAAFASDDLLDFLDIEPESFRVAAGIVMATMGVLALWPVRPALDETPGDWSAGLYPLGVSLLSGPAALAAAISYGADEGAGQAWGAALPAVLLAGGAAWLATERWRPGLRAVSPLTGALLVAVAAGLVVSGVRDI